MSNNKLLNTAIVAATEAGTKIIELYQSDEYQTEYKSDQSPLTQADKAAHRIISAKLSATPHPLLSEEGLISDYKTRKKWNTFWLVDPLDGTKEFIKKNGEFTVNIALIHHEKPILGVIYIPVTRELYFADENGAYKSSFSPEIENIYEKAQNLPLQYHHSEYIVAASGSHMNIETEQYIKSLQTNNKPLKIISKGSSIKFCLVAEGSVHCYPRMSPTMEWDTAAGHAIAHFAGKSVTSHPNGKPLQYNKNDLRNPNFVVN